MSWTVYRHYKGRHYLGLGSASHSEDLSLHQVYLCLYDNGGRNAWVRPQAMFEGALEDGTRRFAPVGRLRLVQPEDVRTVLAFGYDAWKHGKTFDEYCAAKDSDPNHLRGARYLLEDAAGEPVAALNTLRFRQGLVGFASVATAPAHRGRGRATLLVRAVMELLRFQDAAVRFALFSEIRPEFYARLGFRPLPAAQQRFLPSVAMVTGEEPFTPGDERFFGQYF
jgi:GNAT superfamily N-acetyltransferase